jgi:hypothetical protein
VVAGVGVAGLGVESRADCFASWGGLGKFEAPDSLAESLVGFVGKDEGLLGSEVEPLREFALSS